MIDFLSQPWPWYVSGPLISMTMFLLIYLGITFGVSSTLRTFCTLAGGARYSKFFRFNWRDQSWNLLFVLGTVIGGFLSNTFLSNPEPVAINPEIVDELATFGVDHPKSGFMPVDLFSWESLATTRGLLLFLVGGFLIGFGTRYAGGCTSGHAITGLSQLQWPSLVAVVGFLIGGLVATYLILPFILVL